MTEKLPEWVDGRAFAGWIEGRRPTFRQSLTEQQCRTLHGFRSEGRWGSLGVVDRICVRLNLHINEIPDWIWVEGDPFRRGPGG